MCLSGTAVPLIRINSTFNPLFADDAEMPRSSRHRDIHHSDFFFIFSLIHPLIGFFCLKPHLKASLRGSLWIIRSRRAARMGVNAARLRVRQKHDRILQPFARMNGFDKHKVGIAFEPLAIEVTDGTLSLCREPCRESGRRRNDSGRAVKQLEQMAIVCQRALTIGLRQQPLCRSAKSHQPLKRCRGTDCPPIARTVLELAAQCNAPCLVTLLIIEAGEVVADKPRRTCCAQQLQIAGSSKSAQNHADFTSFDGIADILVTANPHSHAAVFKHFSGRQSLVMRTHQDCNVAREHSAQPFAVLFRHG